MATRRERLENKLARREEWADKAKARSDSHFDTAHKMFGAIPFGQPILVGHHSEKRDRNYRNRAAGHMDKACELSDLAKHHESKAAATLPGFSSFWNAYPRKEGRKAALAGWVRVGLESRTGDVLASLERWKQSRAPQFMPYAQVDQPRTMDGNSCK